MIDVYIEFNWIPIVYYLLFLLIGIYLLILILTISRRVWGVINPYEFITFKVYEPLTQHRLEKIITQQKGKKFNHLVKIMPSDQRDKWSISLIPAGLKQVLIVESKQIIQKEGIGEITQKDVFLVDSKNKKISDEHRYLVDKERFLPPVGNSKRNIRLCLKGELKSKNRPKNKYYNIDLKFENAQLTSWRQKIIKKLSQGFNYSNENPHSLFERLNKLNSYLILLIWIIVIIAENKYIMSGIPIIIIIFKYLVKDLSISKFAAQSVLYLKESIKEIILFE